MEKNTAIPRAYEEVIEFIAAGPTSQAIVTFQPSARARQHLNYERIFL